MDMDDDGSGGYLLSVGRIPYNVIIAVVGLHNLIKDHIPVFHGLQNEGPLILNKTS